MPYRPTPRTEARKEDQRNRILHAARDLASSGGFANAQIAAVAEAAGVATGTVYRYFPSKSHLFIEVFRRACGREVEVLSEVIEGEGTTTERLTRCLELFAQRAVQGRRLAYALIAEPVDVAVDEERIRYRKQYARLFSKLLQEGIDAGEFAVQNVDLGAAAVVGAMSEVLVGPLLPGSETEVSEDELIEEIVQFCLRSVGAKEPSIC